MVQISEVKGNARDNRTATHTHIKGLGLRTDGTAEKQAGGFVGQAAAREVITATILHWEIVLTGFTIGLRSCSRSDQGAEDGW